MLSTAALMGVAAILARTGKPRLALRDAFSTRRTCARERAPGPQRQTLPVPFLGAAALVAARHDRALYASGAQRNLPARAPICSNSRRRSGMARRTRPPWTPSTSTRCKFDDYLFANYAPQDGQPLNLYVA